MENNDRASMMQSNRSRLSRGLSENRTLKKQEMIMSFSLFAGMIFMAWWYRWETADMVWGLWISSLTLGYSFIFVSIAGNLSGDKPFFSMTGRIPDRLKSKSIEVENAAESLILIVIFTLFLGLNRITLMVLAGSILCISAALLPGYLEKQGKPIHSRFVLTGIRLISRLPLVLFMLFFFSVHFFGFHFVHSLFLNAFFPRVNPSDLFNSMEEGFRLYRQFLKGLFSDYWVFIIMGVVTRIPEYVRAFKARTGTTMEPYGNVARMHILIILFGFLYVLKIPQTLMYFLLIIYFFPIGSLMGMIQPKKVLP